MATCRATALGVFLLALAGAVGYGQGSSASGAPTGRIYFVSWRDASENEARARRALEIYSMRPDGSDVRRLTRNRVDDLSPAVSRNGRRIAFIRQRPGGRPELWTMSSNGSGARRVPGVRSAESPTWSPDGRRIAFVAQTPNGSSLWMVNANGGSRERIEFPNPPNLSTDDWPYQVLTPSWSPGGQTIAFSNGMSLWQVDLRSGNVQRLARCTRGYCLSPSWSPNGRSIAYQHVGGPVVKVVPAKGGKPRVVVPTNRGGGGTPSWSPDGRSIVFNRGYLPHPYQELAIVSASGGSQRRLTANFVDDHSASWGR